MVEGAQRAFLPGGVAGLLAQTAQNGGDLAVRPLELALQLCGGDAQHAAAQGGELDERVGRRHADGVVFADLADERFDIQVGALILLRVDDAQIIVAAAGAGAAPDAVAVEHDDEFAGVEASVIAQKIQEALACAR